VKIYEPKHRGMTPGDTTPTPPTTEDRIAKVIGFKDTMLKVQMADGTTKVRNGGTISWRHNNPGNLKYGPFAESHGAIGPGKGGHAVFPTFEVGNAAHYALLFGPDRDYPNMTILAAMQKYAPASDKSSGVPKGGNSPSAYAVYLASKAGVTTGTVLKKLTEEQAKKFVAAMHVYEGFKVGSIT
jgi:hypothetical protein